MFTKNTLKKNSHTEISLIAARIAISPSGGHMSREVSGIMEQLIVFEQLLCRVVRLHALRTDETLHTEAWRQRKQLQFCRLKTDKKLEVLR